MLLAHGQNGAARRHQYHQSQTSLPVSLPIIHQPSTSIISPQQHSHHFTPQQQQHQHQQHHQDQQQQRQQQQQQQQQQQHHHHHHHQSNTPFNWPSTFDYHQNNNLNTINNNNNNNNINHSINNNSSNHNSNNNSEHIDNYTYSTLSQQPEQRFQQLRLSNPDSMQSDTNWHLANGYRTPASATHHRQASQTSSVGSISGPASPFPSASTSTNPRIALSSDPVGEDDSAYYVPSHTFQKALPTPQSTPLRDTFIPSEYPEYQDQIPFDAEAVFAEIMSLPHKSNSHDESMRAPDLTRSSGTSMNDSPATPADEGEEQKAKQDYSRTIPKLDRTMSDVYNDELYSPSFPITSAPASKPMATTSPQADVFAQRLQAANTHHLSAPETSPMAPSRNRSPFRQGSPLAPTGDSFGSATQVSPPPMRIGSAAQMRQKQKAEHDAQVLRQQMQKLSPGQATPKTISPKDALLEYHESEEDARVPLFPPQQAALTIKVEPRAEPSLTNSQPDIDETASQQSFRSMATTRRESSSLSNASSSAQQPSSSFTFVPPSVPGSVQVPQQYPFISHSSRQTSSLSDRTPDFPATLQSMESTTSSDYIPDNEMTRPMCTAADGGTYTCTYHGCTLRFETPAKLQKHKREGHRQSAPLIGGVQSSGNSSDGGNATGSGMTSAALLRNSQAGPHKCERINPSTGKPCNTIFSRPYDLTRHEDTIHNARKQKVRCELCTEEKTFSRNDALTRHMRVVHPEVPWPAGKSRRRNGE